MGSLTRLFEVVGGAARVTEVGNLPAAVGIEGVPTMGELPPPAERPAGWSVFVDDLNGFVVRGISGGLPAWIAAAGQALPGVIYINPGATTLQDALAQAALLSPTPDAPALILGTPGVYGDFSTEVDWEDNVIFGCLAGARSNGAASSDSGDGTPAQPITVKCSNLFWTAGANGAVAGMEGVFVDFDDVGATIDLSGVSDATWQTQSCNFSEDVDVTGNTDGSSRWIDDGSFFSDQADAYNCNFYFSESVTYNGMDVGVGFGGIAIEGRLVDCSTWDLFTDTNGGADGTIDIETRGGEIVSEIGLDTGTTLDGPTTTMPINNVAGDGSGTASMNRGSQSFAITTTGAGATDSFTYPDSSGDDLPFLSGRLPIPTVIAQSDNAAGGTMPTITNLSASGFDLKDYDVSRNLLVLVTLPPVQ